MGDASQKVVSDNSLDTFITTHLSLLLRNYYKTSNPEMLRYPTILFFCKYLSMSYNKDVSWSVWLLKFTRWGNSNNTSKGETFI